MRYDLRSTILGNLLPIIHSKSMNSGRSLIGKYQLVLPEIEKKERVNTVRVKREAPKRNYTKDPTSPKRFEQLRSNIVSMSS